jgi:predicted RNase H-like HicB family nuclease
MLTDYLRAAMRQARYEILPDDGSYYGEIPACPGVWAAADTLEACRDELESVLQAWLVFRLRRRLDLPVLDGMDLVADADVREAV